MNKEQEQIIDEVYGKYADSHFIPPSNPKGKLLSDQLFSVIPMEHSKESFINKIKTDSKFSETWGLKIKERELSLEERQGILEKVFPMYYMDQQFGGEDIFTRNNIPNKLITITYNNETIESYE